MQSLHSEILGKKPDFSELTDIASNLMSLVGDDEASALADKLQEVTDRYGNLVEASETVGQLLTASRQGLRHLVLTYQDLAAWMDAMEQRLNRYKVLAVHTDKLLEQMDDLAVSTSFDHFGFVEYKNLFISSDILLCIRAVSQFFILLHN